MQAVCKFCGKPIDTDHYFITKAGSCCLNCSQNIKDILKQFHISKEDKDGRNMERCKKF